MLIVDYGREGIQWILDSLAEIGTFTVLWAKTMGRMSPNILMNELIHSIVFQNLLNSFSKSS
jgi:hypothetical protein